MEKQNIRTLFQGVLSNFQNGAPTSKGKSKYLNSQINNKEGRIQQTATPGAS
jgi:hypothetical protein